MAGLTAGPQACGWTGSSGSTSELGGSHLTGQYPTAELERVSGFRADNAIFLIHWVTRGHR
jgi:hypothetical protein